MVSFELPMGSCRGFPRELESAVGVEYSVCKVYRVCLRHYSYGLEVRQSSGKIQLK